MRGCISRALISDLSALRSASRLSERGVDTLEAPRRADVLAERLRTADALLLACKDSKELLGCD